MNGNGVRGDGIGSLIGEGWSCEKDLRLNGKELCKERAEKLSLNVREGS